MSSKATMTEIAEAADVSLSTVSRVIGGGQGISQKTIDRVMRAATSIGYRPKSGAGTRPGRQADGLRIGLIHWSSDRYSPQRALSHHLHQQFIFEMWSAANEAGHILCLDYRDLDHPAKPSPLMAPWAVDGVVVKGQIEQPALDSIPGDLPAIYFRLPQVFSGSLSSVTCNYTRGISECIHYLKGLGHRRIAMFSLAHQRLNDLEKIVSYQQTLAALGLDDSSYLVTPAIDDFAGDDNAACLSAVEQWLGMAKPPTAIISSESFCQQLAGHLEAKGLSVPRDISLIDAVTGASPHESFRKHATRLQMPVREMCQAAVEQIVRRIERPDLPPQTIQLPMQLIKGDTAAAAKHSD